MMMNNFQRFRGIFVVAIFLLLIPVSKLEFVDNVCKFIDGTCNKTFYINIYITVYRVLLTFLIASTVGTFLGIFIYRNSTVQKISQPIIDFIRSIPVVILITLAIVLGIKDNSPVLLWVLAANFAVWPIVLSVSNVLGTMHEVTRHSIDQLNLKRKTKLIFIWLPLVWNQAKDSGFKLSISNSLMATITLEYVLSNGGCNLCIDNPFSAPGIGGLFHGIQNGPSIYHFWKEILFVFFITGIVGVIINFYVIILIDKFFKWVLKRIGKVSLSSFVSFLMPLLLAGFCFQTNVGFCDTASVKKKLIPDDYDWKNFTEKPGNSCFEVKNDSSRKNLAFDGDTVYSKVRFENVQFNNFNITHCDVKSTLNLCDVKFGVTGYISDSKINNLIISNLTGTRLVINGCVIDTLYVLVNPDNPNPVKFTLDKDTIHFLEVINTEYFSKPVQFSLISVVLNKLKVDDSFIRANDLTFTTFSPGIELVDVSRSSEENIKVKLGVLSSLANQYKTHGDYFRYIQQRAELKKMDIDNSEQPTKYLYRFLFEYLGGYYFTSLGGILWYLLLTCIGFVLIYVLGGFFREFGEIYQTNPFGNIPETSNIKLRSIKFSLYKNESRGFLNYLTDTLFFTINHFFVLKSDRSFNITNLMLPRSRGYVPVRYGKFLAFLQFGIGVWIIYAVSLTIYNIIQATL